ncbi:MAG TPA: hypothetical protein VJO13_17260, partial [Ktedonobacterales bacterium]|nr:hypothetical protein [Ktedonobacterales bacterium]
LQVFLHLHQLRLHPLKVFHIESHWWACSFLWDLLTYSHARVSDGEPVARIGAVALTNTHAHEQYAFYHFFPKLPTAVV